MMHTCLRVSSPAERRWSPKRGLKRGDPAIVSAQSIFKAPEVERPSGQAFALTALRMAIGWHLLYEGIAKILQGNWSSASYLSSSTWIFAKFFRLIAEVPWLLKTVDIVNIWALTLLGLCLVLGYLTRSTALCSAGLLMLYYVTHPPFRSEEHTSELQSL